MRKKDVFVLAFLFVFIFLVFFLIGNPVFFYKKTANNLYINKEQIFKDVEFLSKMKISREADNPESLNEAANYIEKEFAKTNCKIEIQKFIVNNIEFKNIICSFGVENKERLVIGAHYDAFGLLPGADDNASGVAGILELARIMSREKPALKNRIDFVAYSLEEPPYFNTESMGSFKHAQKLKNEKAEVRGMISLEMIGYFSEENNSQTYPSPVLALFYPHTGNFIAVVSKLSQPFIVRNIKKSILENSNMDVKVISFVERLAGINFSDHLNYWKFGYQAAMITDTSFYRNKNYHETTDTIEKLNFDRMSEVVMGVYFAIIKF